MADMSRFAKLKMTKADPPAQLMLRATDASPLQEAMRTAHGSGAWQSFQNVPSVPVIEFAATAKRPARKLSESDILVQEIRRACRQLGYALSVRVADVDGKPDVQHVFFRVTDKKTKHAAPDSEAQPELPFGPDDDDDDDDDMISPDLAGASA